MFWGGKKRNNEIILELVMRLFFIMVFLSLLKEFRVWGKYIFFFIELIIFVLFFKIEGILNFLFWNEYSIIVVVYIV